MSTWFVAEKGKTQGPFTHHEIRAGLAAGRYRLETMVWKQGFADWQPIAQVPELTAAGHEAAAMPPLPNEGRQCHEIDYEIFGNEMQFVEIELDPEESAVAEAGAMMHMAEGIEMETIFGDGSAQQSGFFDKLVGAGKRLITGESLFCTVFTNQRPGKARVAFAAPYPGKIIPLDLRDYGNRIICQKDAFLCAAKGVAIGVAFQKRIGTGLFGGEGFIMEKLEGDGLAFLHAGGTIVQKELAAGETLRVDTGCLVALTQEVDYDIQYVGNVKSAIFGGEGLFFAVLRGPGHVWLQSLPFSRLAGRIYESMPQTVGNNQTGEGSVLGGIGRLFEQ